MNLNELHDLIARHAGPTTTTVFSGVKIGRSDVSATEHEMTGSVMALVVSGRKCVALGDRVYEYGRGQYFVASLDMPILGRFLDVDPEHPALGFGLDLDPSAIADLLLQSGATDPHDGRGGPPSCLFVSDAPDHLIDAAIRLLRLLDRPRDLPVLAPLIKREILWWLIVGEQGAAVRQLGLADSSLSQVARATRWIREHYAKSFRVEDVAGLCGMSTSAFYRNFQAATAMPPLQFQKQIRLQQARLLLAVQPKDISGVGYRVGYESASQFSREYRRQFGIAPSQDATRLREIKLGASGAAR